MRRSRAWTGAAVVAALAMMGAGCGDDDESNEAAEDPNAAYCELARELDEQDDFPTAEQLEELRDAAPEEISEPINTVVDKFVAAIEAGDFAAAFEDPAVNEAFETIEPFEAEECGIESEDEDEQDPSVTVPDPAAAQVAVTATEYAFAFDAPAAGRTTFTMTNAGAERHVMFLFRIEEGRSFNDVVESEGDEGIAEEWESKTAGAGEEAVLTADLAPGAYGMVCYLPTPEGESHDSLGMVSEFTVA